MKNSYFFFLIITSYFSLAAMQAGEATAWVKNDSPDEITVIYQLKGGKPVKRNVFKNDAWAFTKNIDELELLNVIPYGEIKGKISKETISFGLLGPENLAARIKNVRLQNPFKRHIVLIIRKKPYIGGVLPYDFEVVAQDESPEPKRVASLTWELFPKVAEAVQLKKKIEPRYFLELGPNPSEDDIKKAYDQLQQKWKPMLPANKAQEAMKFINAAHEALLYQAKFEKLVAEEQGAQTILLE